MTRLCIRHSLSRVVLKVTITLLESGPVLLFGWSYLFHAISFFFLHGVLSHPSRSGGLYVNS